MTSFRLFLVSLLLSACAHAQSSAPKSGLFHGSTLQETSLDQALSQVTPGSIVIIGENHGFKTHQDQQVTLMNSLRRQGLKVSVGMEFFTFTDQTYVDQYRQGFLNEIDFLNQIKWGSPSFDFYRAQVTFPNLTEGSHTWALNAPRSVTSKVAKNGLTSLTTEERALLPPQFELGRDSYRKRFLALMPHLPNPVAGERYFAAQSIWDDTMAWRATEFLTRYPEQVLVIVVGDFHVQYGGGLPDRIRIRAPQRPVWTFSQVNSADLSPAELAGEMNPSPEYGPRADFLWVAPAL